MSIRKILLDYSEYLRLRDIEERYEALLKSKSGQTGQGRLLLDVASSVNKTEEENALQTPLVKKLPTITLPASAIVEDTKTIPNRSGKTNKATIEPWYFIGPPEKKKKNSDA